MSDPSLGLTMLGLIVVAIMMGFPTAFTLMGLGMIFGYIAFWIPGAHWYDNRAFDLIVQRAYGVMTNDALLSIPLFVFMGYIMERAALVDKMFHSVQLAFRRVPASLAVTTMLVSAFWGIASGIVGAVVVLMGVIAMGPMLKAGYDVRLAAGTITAGGTLGILIPPSVMLIVYAAVAGQSIVKLYAAAMLPGFFLTGLYLLRRLEGGRTGSVVPGLVAAAFRPAVSRAVGGYRVIANDLAALAVPLLLTLGTLAGAWWYVVIYNAPTVATVSAPVAATQSGTAPTAGPQAGAPPATASSEEQPQEVGIAGDPTTESETKQEGVQEVTSFRDTTASTAGRIPAHFYQWFWGSAVFCGLLLLWYFWRMNGEQLEILKELIVSVVPLGVLTVVVLVVILFGICTATESAAIGALGALYLAVMARYPKAVWRWSLLGVVVGVALGWYEGEDVASLIVAASIGGTFTGTVIPGIWYLRKSPELRENLKQATFLTAKTTAMVCWLFVGSALFSAVFALHGGQSLIERWVLSMNLSPVGFQFTAQLIIFLLGWPLEWTEIIVIFCPIFIPLLSHFNVDPILFGTMVAVNLQAAFLSPPVAMSAFYLKGVSPKHVTLNQIFAGMMPYMIIVCICLVFMYIWPGMTLWLPEFLYGK
ncbi:MAG: C4-dicarboxylate ABC transporter [Candidatus Rokubacteria bacterium 13_1_40CM_68_15]|nr:MAG: C4-dicarboxylate ABC transporter [Candidatus Rokubacteria bacterium 13_1_40CM_68_15]